MNAGLGHLTELKQRLLPASMISSVEFDAVILAIGRGTAAAFDAFTNRRLVRAAGQVVAFSANRSHFILPGYPVEQITAVELRGAGASEWSELSVASAVWQWDEESGLVQFCADLGIEADRVRLTWTGGYWFQTAEPTDSQEVQPASATVLPDDLKEAWLQQCEAIWAARDKLGVAMIAQPDQQPRLADAKITDAVKATLQGYIRYQIS